MGRLSMDERSGLIFRSPRERIRRRQVNTTAVIDLVTATVADPDHEVAVVTAVDLEVAAAIVDEGLAVTSADVALAALAMIGDVVLALEAAVGDTTKRHISIEHDSEKSNLERNNCTRPSS